MFRHPATAYLVAYMDAEDRFTDVGIYSEYPLTCRGPGDRRQKLLLSMGASDYEMAVDLLKRELTHRFNLHWVYKMRTMRSQEEDAKRNKGEQRTAARTR